MTREEAIIEAGIEYSIQNSPYCIGGDNFYEKARELNRNKSFEAGVIWADKNPKSPWISVDEDLPCNHEALLVTQGGTQTIKVITAYEDGDFSSDFMIKDSFNDNWDWNCWNGHYAPNYWMIPPKLPKE